MTSTPSDAINHFEERDLEKKRNERDRDVMQQLIFEDKNPHPLLVSLILALVLVVVWLIYEGIFKPNLSGLWYDSDANLIDIDHPLFKNSLKIWIGDTMLKGEICGGILMIEGAEVGIWNGKNLIKLFDGGVWKRFV